MVKPHWIIGRALGVEIGIHPSWLVLAALVVLSLVDTFLVNAPNWSLAMVWSIASATAALFFASLILHELAHAAVAKARGLQVRSITLFALGGVAQIAQESADARTEFWMGIVGPLTSALIGLSCLALAQWLAVPAAEAGPQPAAVLLAWLGAINAGLAVFNMIPGFPLDGGRVMRAAVWSATGDRSRATRWSARSGQAFALGFILFGLVRFFQGAGLSGLWLAFIGYFLLEAATASLAQVALSEALSSVKVADIMSKSYPMVAGEEDLETFVGQELMRSGRRCFIVEERGRVAGLITPQEVRRVDPSQWSSTPVDRAMRPFSELQTVHPETPVSTALELMGREDVNQLPVVDDGHLRGLVSRSEIIGLLQTRSEVQV